MDFKTVLIFALGLGIAASASSGRFEHNDFTVIWEQHDDKKSIFFNVTAKADGWIAIGFSEAGSMTDADMIIATVTSDTEVEVQVSDSLSAFAVWRFRPEFNPNDFLQDYWNAAGTRGPVVDTQQDLTEVKGSRVHGPPGTAWAHMEFRRLINTGDPNNQDLVLPPVRFFNLPPRKAAEVVIA